MKVIYLKNTHNAKINDIKEVRDIDARALIALGIVKKHIESKSTEKVKKVIKSTKTKTKKKTED